MSCASGVGRCGAVPRHAGCCVLDAMSSRIASTSCLLAGLVAVGVVACIDAPQLSGGVGNSTSSNDPAQGGAGGGGSAVSGARDGMVLVPAVTLAAGAGVAPTGIDPAPKDPANGAKPPKNNGDGNGNGNGNGHGAPDAGAGSMPPGTTPPAAGSTGTGSGTPAPTQVVVAAFWLDAVEVTVASYRACIAAGACSAPADGAGCTLGAGLEAHPVNCVSSDQARAYCTWSAKRLVRNDEWNAATVGSTGRIYPWGAQPPAADRLDACGPECSASGMYGASDGFVGTAPAGSFPLGRSPDGADDLAGNVAEWVDGALVPFARGGSYADVAATAVASASPGVASATGPTVGFRCAADADAGR
jgi:formylglycine-generating enzyme required for sulfatase activity